MSNKAMQGTIMSLRAQLAKAKVGMSSIRSITDAQQLAIEGYSRQVSDISARAAKAGMEVTRLRNALDSAHMRANKLLAETKFYKGMADNWRENWDKECDHKREAVDEAGKYRRRARTFEWMFWALVAMNAVRMVADYVS